MLPAVIYWFQLERSADGDTIRWIPRIIHDDSGVGVEVVVEDLNQDSQLDIIVGNKKGTFVHLQRKAD